MEFRERLVSARRRAGLTQDQVAALTSKTRQAVSKWERGEAEPSREDIILMAQAFGISVSYLLNESRASYGLPPGVIIDAVDVPIIGRVCAGPGMEPIEERQGSVPTPREWVRGAEHFWLIVRGDSMTPRLLDGHLVLVRHQRTIDRDGQVAVVCLPETDDAVIRRVYRQGRELLLVAENSAYEPIRTREAWIVGVVTRFAGEI